MDAKYQQLKSLVGSLETDYGKFSKKKVKVSATRLRQSLLDIKKLCDALRKDIQEELKQMPIKQKQAVKTEQLSQSSFELTPKPQAQQLSQSSFELTPKPKRGRKKA